MLQAETIFDSTHAKIHIATSRGSSEIGRGRGGGGGGGGGRGADGGGESTCLQMFDTWPRRRDGREKLPISTSSVLPAAAIRSVI